MLKKNLVFISLILLFGCAQQKNVVLESKISQTLDRIQCGDLRNELFWQLKSYVIEKNEIPSYQEISTLLDQKLAQKTKLK